MSTTITVTFTAAEPLIKITDPEGNVREYWGGVSGRDPDKNLIVRAARQEFETNGTASGSISITAA